MLIYQEEEFLQESLGAKLCDPHPDTSRCVTDTNEVLFFFKRFNQISWKQTVDKSFLFFFLYRKWFTYAYTSGRIEWQMGIKF